MPQVTDYRRGLPRTQLYVCGRYSTVEIFAVGEVSDQEDEYDTDSGNDMDDDDHDSYPHTTILTWGPFLERLGNLTGPKSYFEIKFSRKVRCVLTSNEVHFVSLADNFTVQFSNLLKLLSRMKKKKKLRNGPDNYRELRETGPRSGRAIRAHFRLDL